MNQVTIIYALLTNTNANGRWVESCCWLSVTQARIHDDGVEEEEDGRKEGEEEEDAHRSSRQWKQKARKEERSR